MGNKLSIEEMQEIAKSRDGECLSEEYLGCYIKLKWRCKEGHEWLAQPNNIKYGKWCPKCAKKFPLTIEEMQEIAKSKGGKCLSETYVNIFAKLNWKCKKGHIWKSTPNSVKRGSWCPICAHNIPLTIEEMQEIAKSKGGECVSDKYINSKTKLVWKCKEGHTWKATPDDIKSGNWCPECVHHIPLTIEEMQEIAKSRDGECLSDKYINSVTKLIWKCKEGHIWEAAPGLIKYNKTWCPVCTHQIPLTIEEMQEIAKSRNGKCLSDIYRNNNTKLKWQCEKGHVWETIPSHIKGGSWCPVCNESKGENIICKYLNLYGIKHDRQKTFSDCKGKRNLLPFDFYLPAQNILIEYDGEQHYVPYRLCGKEKAQKKLLEQQRNDQTKNDYCEKNNIPLIRIPYTVKDIEKYLTDELLKYSVNIDNTA